MNQDLISRKAAIDALDALCDRECEYSKQQRSFMCGACRLGSAFDVIDELPSAQPEHTETHSCDCERTKTHDLISRRAVMAKLNMLNDGALYTHADYVDAVRSVPTIEPPRMRGRWIPTEPDEPCFYQCSICRCLNDDTDNFCPNCGADMREKE